MQEMAWLPGSSLYSRLVAAVPPVQLPNRCVTQLHTLDTSLSMLRMVFERRHLGASI